MNIKIITSVLPKSGFSKMYFVLTSFPKQVKARNWLNIRGKLIVNHKITALQQKIGFPSIYFESYKQQRRL